MTVRSPEEVAEKIDKANLMTRIAYEKRQPFIDAGWSRYSTDIYKNFGEVRVSVSYVHERDVFSLRIYLSELFVQDFNTAGDALDWCAKLEASLRNARGN